MIDLQMNRGACTHRYPVRIGSNSTSELTPMPEEQILPKDRIVSSFKHLNAISAELNAAVKELNKPIGRLEFVLKDLNLGVSAWHQIAGSEDENGSYWSRD